MKGKRVLLVTQSCYVRQFYFFPRFKNALYLHVLENLVFTYYTKVAECLVYMKVEKEACIRCMERTLNDNTNLETTSNIDRLIFTRSIACTFNEI